MTSTRRCGPSRLAIQSCAQREACFPHIQILLCFQHCLSAVPRSKLTYKPPYFLFLPAAVLLQGKRCFLAPNTPSEGTIFLFNGQVSNITYRHGQYLSQNCLDFENHMVVNNGSDEEGCKWNCSK